MSVESPPPSEPAETTAPLLDIRDLVLEYGRPGPFGRTPLTAVNNVSLTLERGSTLGIVGQSGSGKSSLVKAIVGLEKPTSGEIRIKGRLIDASADAQLWRRKTIQMVFQDSLSSLNPKRTIESQLLEPLIVNSIVPRAQGHSRVLELLDAVGLPSSVATKRPLQVSGGQRQRVNIARALASEPELIIADEPTSALDVSVRAQVLDLLTGLQRERGLAVLFISHDLHVIRHVSDSVIVMKTGEVVEAGLTESLFSRPQHPYTRELLAATPTIDAALAASSARGLSAFSR
jgi:peptide/nickel transport system ATP-binding protein